MQVRKMLNEQMDTVNPEQLIMRAFTQAATLKDDNSDRLKVQYCCIALEAASSAAGAMLNDHGIELLLAAEAAPSYGEHWCRDVSCSKRNATSAGSVI